jgi:DNA-binding NtrC family response regulator
MTQVHARILIADDEETFRLSTATLLRQKGYVCDCAQDSEEATRLLQESYDLLIADIRMPGNSELELLQTVHEGMPELPVVVLTGYPSLPTAIESLRLSISDYLIKPVGLPELQQAITRALEKGRLLRAGREASVETAQLIAALDHIEQTMTTRGGGDKQPLIAWGAKRYVEQAVAHIARLSLAVGQVVGGLDEGGEQSADVCRVMRCSRLAVYEQVLERTVEVLARTKNAFKSKELGELRKHVEDTLKANRRLG